MKRLILGLFVAAMAITISAFSIVKTNKQSFIPVLVAVSPTQWKILNLLDQAITWDCFEGGFSCKGVLKRNASPDRQGFYDNSEVLSWETYSHYEIIPD